jgi:long-subunit acyl-CoA synthetase (AMP-forming)
LLHRASPVCWRIVDENNKEILGDGVGQLQVKTPSIMYGYRNELQTKEVFTDDGWFKTGDTARSIKLKDGCKYADPLGRDNVYNSFVTAEGKKISGVLVDEFIGEIEGIAAVQTMALPIKSQNEAHVFVCHMTLDKDFCGNKENLMKSIIRKCRMRFKGAFVPVGYKFTAMPVSITLHKRDLALMAKDYNGFCDLINEELTDVHFKT